MDQPCTSKSTHRVPGKSLSDPDLLSLSNGDKLATKATRESPGGLMALETSSYHGHSNPREAPDNMNKKQCCCELAVTVNGVGDATSATSQ